MENNLFRNLSPEEEADFRKHARNSYIPTTKINPVWHPVYRDECEKINAKSAEPLADQPGLEWMKGLKASWCSQEHDDTNDFLNYPKDGECTCGVWKHHVHCAHGYILQIG